jgi:hypothetical protein
MNINNNTNSTVNDSTKLIVDSDGKSSLLNPLEIFYMAIISILITLAILFIIYIIRKRKIGKVETAKIERSVDLIARSITN